jgi:3-keto-L-gulonate-6-phosphate decarboxylase
LSQLKLLIDFIFRVKEEALEVLKEGVPVLVDEGVDVVDHVAGIVPDQKVLQEQSRQCFDDAMRIFH